MSTPIPPKPAAASSVSGSALKSVGRFFVRLVTWPARLSLPGKIACLTAVLLIILAVVVWLVIRNDPKHVELYHVLTWQRGLIVAALIVVIPIFVYWGLRLWLEVERSAYPEIDFAWKAGMDALAENGLSIDAIPIFVVLGSSGEEHERAVMNASGRSFRIYGVPEGPAPLHWYAGPDGVYLFCTQVGALSALSSLLESEGAVADPEFIPQAVAPAAATADAPTPSSGSQEIRGTISVDQLNASSHEQPAAQAAAAPQQGGSEGLRGTMMFQPVGGSAPAATAPPPASSGSGGQRSGPPKARSVRREQPALLPAKEAAEQRRRLRYLCRKLAQAREPLCPANGLLTLLPFESIVAGPTQANELEKAVRSDLTTAQRTLNLRCPVTALVVGFEEEPGFAELVRRVGPERAQAQRFGRGYDLRSVALAEELFGFCSHVTGAFEDWVYTLFREQDALLRPGNTRLYGLLCRVRFRFKALLAEILADGFGIDPERQSEDEAFLFSGCYFAATGNTPDRQAFVRGVFDKLEDEQESIEWTAKAISAHRLRRRLAVAGGVLSVVLTLTLLGMMFLPRS